MKQQVRAACRLPCPLPRLPVLNNGVAITGKDIIILALALAAGGEEFVDLLDDDFLSSLAKKYGVSSQALVNRLKNLGYIQE